MTDLVIGSRGSTLALTQSRQIQNLLRSDHPDLRTRIDIIRTTGDRLSAQELSASSDAKGLFVKEIEQALLDGRIDLAVHSLKDMPVEIPDGLELAAIPLREDPRDALASAGELSSWGELPEGARIGTSSLRRQRQALLLRKDLQVSPVRGNVDTRLGKLDRGEFDCIVLAAAGLRRLGLSDRISCALSVDDMIPAVGQGALALETRSDDSATIARVRSLHDESTSSCVAAERIFLDRMGGGCQVPIAGFASLDGGRAVFRGLVASPSGPAHHREIVEGPVEDLRDLARRAADSLLSRAESVLAEIHTLQSE